MPRPSTHRSGRVFVHALVLVAIGGAIGTADAVLRSDKLAKKRAAPPPLTLPDREPRTGNGSTPSTAEQPPVQPTESKPEAQPVPPQDTGGTFVFTPADKLPAGHITVEQAQHLYSEGAVFVDARKKELYIEGHVPQAFRADMASFRGREPAIVSMVPKEMVLVVYCGGGNCDESEHVAQLLDASGFKTIYIMHDGFPGWKAAGYEVESGEGME